MGKLLENLEKYFKETPKDVIEKEFKELEHLNSVGSDVLEYAKSIKVFR